MSFSKAQDASPDARAFLNKVLESPFGVKITFGTAGHEKTCPHCKANNINRSSAWNFRQRCFYTRAVDRALNTKIYGPDEPMHNRSTFDAVTLFVIDEPDGRCSIVGVTNYEGLAQVAKLEILSNPFEQGDPNA